MRKLNNLFLIIFCLIALIFVGCSKNEEDNAQQVAKDFVEDLYAVSNEEVENYNSLLNSDPSESIEMNLYNAVQINDGALKLLTTENAYEVILKNRDNLKFTAICYEADCTMQVTGIQLSENKADIDNNTADYNFEVKLKLIFNDGTETEGTAKGTVSLSKIDDNWKITRYKQGSFPDFLSELLN